MVQKLFCCDEHEALAQLSAFLKPRIEAAEKGEFSPSTFADIKQKARNNIRF